MLEKIKKQIKDLLVDVGIDESKIELVIPPNVEMGDLALPCFGLGGNPKEFAENLAEKIIVETQNFASVQMIDKIETAGPYVNFYLNANELAKLVLEETDKNYGKNDLGKGKKIMVEFAHPNTHKMFHIGHLRNIITGESVSRILENAGYRVIRANYQGDVGMHIAKCLYTSQKSIVISLKSKSIEERVKYLGECYTAGATAFEKSEEVKKEVAEINEKIYTQDESIKEIYETTRGWSLEYFDNIYKRVGTKFDRLYFESETYKRGKEIVQEFLKKKVFKESDGAVIFEGSKYDLHDRVFINSKGFPTYEAKDLALAELQFKESDLEKIIHVVGKEQTEYFRVLFKALGQTLSESKGREFHLDYGWVSLKKGKMSSRTGNVVLGEWLLGEVEKIIAETHCNASVHDPHANASVQKIAQAAVKYAMLRIGVRNDMAFDIEESVSTTGESGPYLLYIGARIGSILCKQKIRKSKNQKIKKIEIKSSEKQLLLKLAGFEEVAKRAAEELDPSKIAKYLFDLAQSFNVFYTKCPVLQAEEDIKIFRLSLIGKVKQVMEKGLYLLGIETVEKM